MSIQLSEQESEVQAHIRNTTQRAARETQELHDSRTADFEKAWKAQTAKAQPMREALDKALKPFAPKPEPLSEFDQQSLATFDAVHASMNPDATPPGEAKPDDKEPTAKDGKVKLPKSILGLNVEDQPPEKDPFADAIESASGKAKQSLEAAREAHLALKTKLDTQAAELATAREAVARHEAATKENATVDEAAEQAQADSAFELAQSEAAKNIAPFVAQDGDEEWNAQADELKAQARALFAGELSLREMAEAAHYAVAGKVYAGMVAHLTEKLNGANAMIKRMTALSPSLGDHNGGRFPEPEIDANTPEGRNALSLREFERAREIVAARG